MIRRLRHFSGASIYGRDGDSGVTRILVDGGMVENTYYIPDLSRKGTL